MYPQGVLINFVHLILPQRVIAWKMRLFLRVILKQQFIYLQGRVREKEKDKERRFSISTGFLSQMAAAAGSGPCQI